MVQVPALVSLLTCHVVVTASTGEAAGCGEQGPGKAAFDCWGCLGDLGIWGFGDWDLCDSENFLRLNFFKTSKWLPVESRMAWDFCSFVTQLFFE